MGLIRFLLALLPLAFASIAVPAHAQSVPPAEAFGRLPSIASVSLSPNGEYIAVVREVNGKLTGLVRKAGAPDKPVVFDIGDWVFRGLTWANNERILIVVSKKRDLSFLDAPIDIARTISVKRDGTSPIVLMADQGRAFRSFANFTSIVDVLPNDPDHILLTAADSKSTGVFVNLYKVNVSTGEATVAERGSADTVAFGTDRTGAVRFRIERNEDRRKNTIFIRKTGETRWSKFIEQRDKDRTTLAPLEFSDDPNVMYVLYRAKETDRLEVWTYDLTAMKPIARVAAHPRVDMDGVVSERFSGLVVGVSYNEAWETVQYIEDGWSGLQQRLKTTFPNAERTHVTSVDQDYKNIIVQTEGQTDPGTFYHVNLERGLAVELGKTYPDVPASAMGKRTYISYKARDGLSIPAFLTLPPGGSGKNLPTIMLPHGGPEARDFGGFDFFAHFLASRGYAVIQPQFRGSDGYGGAFTDAGYKEWGFKMQDDLTDGLKYLVGQGITDPARVCIVGASYGGYAALAGATVTPELYKCVIAIAPVSDLIEMQAWEVRRTGSNSPVVEYWKRVIGDPAADRDRLVAGSAARNVDKVRAPILLIHGKRDNVVPIEQSEIMADALKAAGKPFEFVEIETADHHFITADVRIRLLKEMDRFLAAQMPVR